jgi:hypothetical protein
LLLNKNLIRAKQNKQKGRQFDMPVLDDRVSKVEPRSFRIDDEIGLVCHHESSQNKQQQFLPLKNVST